MNKLYIYLIIALVFLGTLAGLKHYYTKTKELEAQVSTNIVNIKSLERGMLLYKDKNGTLHTQTIQMQKSIDELKYSNDQTDKALADSIKRWKIKEKDVVSVAQIGQALEKKTVLNYAPGSYTQKDTSYDFSTEPWITNKVTFTHQYATNDLSIRDTITEIAHGKRETIDPPKKLFFLRWFQKKQTVIQTDIVHSNPYIHTTNQKFIHIVKD